MKSLTRTLALLATIALFGGATPVHAKEAHEHDIVIYGGSCAAVIAAVQAKKMGKSVIIVCPDTILPASATRGPPRAREGRWSATRT